MNKKKAISHAVAAIALLVAGAALMHLTGPVYGLGIGYGLAFFHQKVAALVSTKVK